MRDQLIGVELRLCWDLMDDLATPDPRDGRTDNELLRRFIAALDRALAMLEGADEETRAKYMPGIKAANDDLSAHLDFRSRRLEAA